MANLDAPPPHPPTGGGEGSPTYSSMMPQDEQPDVGASAGMSQTGNAAMRLAMEVDASMKLLAQMVPQLGPWAEMATSQLRSQLGAALSAGSVPTGAEPSENAQFPGGEGRL